MEAQYPYADKVYTETALFTSDRRVFKPALCFYHQHFPNHKWEYLVSGTCVERFSVSSCHFSDKYNYQLVNEFGSPKRHLSEYLQLQALRNRSEIETRVEPLIVGIDARCVFLIGTLA